MKVASPRMKWSEGKKAMVASGSHPRTQWPEGKKAMVASGARRRIQCAAWRMPAAVPRSLGCTRTYGGSAPPVNSWAMWPVWARTVTTTVREPGMRSATRSRVWRSRLRGPSSGTYCLGRSSPSTRRIRGRRRVPSPPASTTGHGSPAPLRVALALTPPTDEPRGRGHRSRHAPRLRRPRPRDPPCPLRRPHPSQVPCRHRAQRDQRHERGQEEAHHEPGRRIAALFPGDPGRHGGAADPDPECPQREEESQSHELAHQLVHGGTSRRPCLPPDAQQEQNDDQAQRNAQKPEQYEWHVTNPPC